jgi:dipeptidyl aminopeptidase/acylaminoacyl peptidase
MKYIPKMSIALTLIFFIKLNAQQDVLTSYNIFNLKTVVETAVSPDDRMIAYSVVVPRPFDHKPGNDYRHLYVYNIADDSAEAIVADDFTLYSLQWTPDSKNILFRSTRDEVKTSQVYIVDAKGGAPEAITSFNNPVTQFELSPDGKKIAFISDDGQSDKKKLLLEKGYDAEIFEEEYLDKNLYIRDFNSEEPKQITSGVTVFDFKWSPDSKKILAQIAEKNLVDDSYMFKRIYVIDTEKGIKEKIVDNPGKLTKMAWSTDNKHIAFVAGVDIHDPVSGSVFIADVTQPKPFTELRNYSEGFIGSVDAVSWKDDNTVLFSSEEGVNKTLREQKIDGKESKLIIEGGKAVFGNFEYKDGKVFFAGNTPEHPSEVYVYNTSNKELKKLTDNNSWLSGIKLAKQEKITYKARDGLEIEGVLIYPLNFIEGDTFPLIVYVHGGPEACEKNGWLTSYSKWGQIAAAKDYFVFYPNYRSSSGRGVEFSKLGFGDLAAGEFDDIIDGIDYLVDKGYVDNNKVGIGGGSYGGYFAAWGATKHTERFAAAVSFVGVSNMISKRNTTDIPYEDYYVHWGIWTHEDYELVYSRSPVKYSHQSKTPTLILHGKNDPRVHPAQSLELYRSLKLHGSAPVRLIWYPGQGHGNSKNTSRLDYAVRTMEWFDYYLKSDKPKNEMPEKYIEFLKDDVVELLE